MQINNDHGIQLIASEIKRATESFTELKIISSGMFWIVYHQDLRGALKEYDSFVRPMLQRYGPSENYVVLGLHNDATISDIKAVVGDLDQDIELQDRLLLLANDDVIEEYQSDLEKMGFRFKPDWLDKDSSYMRVLKAGTEFGTVFTMFYNNGSWFYSEKI